MSSSRLTFFQNGRKQNQGQISSIAQFLYEMMCRHRCFEIQINDQGPKFVNEVSTTTWLKGVGQTVTSACYPQENRLVERQIGTIKNSLVKVLEDNPEMWSQIIEGILFAHRVSRHSSTKYSPFMLMYNRQSVLSTDVKHNWTKMKAKNEKTEKEMEMKSNHSVSNFLVPSFHQQRKSEKYSRMMQPAILELLRKNNNESMTTNDLIRRVGSFHKNGSDLTLLLNISDKGVATLKNASGMTLENKYNIFQLSRSRRQTKIKIKWKICKFLESCTRRNC